jgi:Bacterial PH domain
VRSTPWYRPYANWTQVFTGFIAMFGTVFMTFVLMMLAARWSPSRALGTLLATAGLSAFGAIWLTFAWRLHRTALVISDVGVRVRWLLQTRTVPWEQVKDFSTGQNVRDPGRLWVELADGGRMRTPVRRFEGFFMSTVRDGGSRLRRQAYDDLLRTLNHELRAARARASKGAAPPPSPTSPESGKRPPAPIKLRSSAPADDRPAQTRGD